MQGAEEKAVKAFVEAANNRMYNPYHFANLIKIEGGYPAQMLHKVAIAWFMLSDIDYGYGVGDPMVGQMASRIVHEVLSDYEELPEYNVSRGFENRGGGSGGTWDDYESRYTPSFIRRGFDS
jgi:hypothetical protein